MRENTGICLLNDSFPPLIDGVANAVVNYAQRLTERGDAVTVATPAVPGADDSAFPFPVLRYPSFDTRKKLGYVSGRPFSPELVARLQKEGVGVLHTHCPIVSTFLARELRDVVDAPIVLTYHTKFDIDIANAVRGKLLQEEAARILVENISACDEVWTVSNGAGENLCKLGYKGRYTVMPNGVDFPRGRVDDALIRQVTGDYDLPEGLPLFLFVGRMMWYKGIRIILDALKKLSESGHDFRMVFVGGGNDKDEIVAYCESLGLSDRVFFVAPIHDRSAIRAWYCRADLFLFPSTFDTNGLVVREAAACGLASVLVAGSCAAEDVTDGVNGFLIEENADSMAAMLEKLAGDAGTMHAVGENALRDLYMSWEEAVRRAYERYAVVIDNYRSGRCRPKEQLSDEFIHAVAKNMDASNRNRQRLTELKDEVKSGISEDRQQLRSMWDELTQYMDRFL